MLSEYGTAGPADLFVAVFSDAPLPDIEAAIVGAHPGDEAVSTSWLMSRLQERASVYCLTEAAHACPGGLARESAQPTDALAARAATIASAALAGVPYDRCHNLGLHETEVARDLEALVWLTTAAVSTLKPRVLVTHACEGKNLDHDATCLAVHLAARLMSRYGAAAPLLVEFPRHGEIGAANALPFVNARQAVKIEFGPESRKVKRRMLRCHAECHAPADAGVFLSESYVLAGTGNPFDAIEEGSGAYLDAPWCQVDDFRRRANEVLAQFSRAVLSSPSQA